MLGPEGFGVANFTTNLSGLFISLVSLGVPLYGMREIAKLKGRPDEIRKTTSELFILHLLYSLLGLLIYSIVVFNSEKLAVNRDIFLVGGLLILVNCLSVEWLYQGLERFRYIAIRTIIIRTISVVGLFLFVTGKEHVFVYVLILVLTQAFNGIVNFVYAHRTVGFVTKGLNYTRHWKNLLLLYGSSLAIAVYVQMDTVMLGFLSTEKDVGLYSATVRISKLPLALITAISFSFLPRISLYFHQENMEKINRLANAALQLIVFYSVPVSFGLFLFADELLLLFSGKMFVEAALSLKIVSFLTFVIGLSNLFGIQILTAAKKDGSLLKGVLAGTIVNFFLNLAFIPFWGFNGATVATAVAEITVTTFTFLMVRKNLPDVKLNFSSIISSVVSCAPFIAVKLLIANQEGSFVISALQVVLCVAVYFIVQRLFRNPIMSISNLKNMLNE